MIEYAFLIPIIPLLTGGLILAWGRHNQKAGVICAITSISVTAFVSYYIFFEVLNGAEAYETGFTWAVFGRYTLSLGILVDGITAVMLLVVATVSLLVHIYSIGYMHGDPRVSRYFGFLNIFTFAMMGLILANNFAQLYICWELVGVCSYFLIGFWFEKKSAADAGKKAFITTRIGDVGLAIAVLILFRQFGDLNYAHIQDNLSVMEPGLLTATAILVFIGAVGKSAQVPLHVWLPDAMEGPTPVSALIHAATMVAAGVFLVARVFFMFEASAAALMVVAVVGTITAFLAATIALTQFDIKRVLAYSTLSQLGYMMMALGLGSMKAAMFHLMTHAFFKACLFLCSGSVIHGSGTQDMRQMGGLRKKMPHTFYTMLIATCAIAGVPFLSGFYSKEAILHAAFAWGGHHGYLIYVIATITAGLTAFYMFRLIFMTFTGEARDAKVHAHESPASMTVPLWILAVMSLTAGKWGVENKLLEGGHGAAVLEAAEHGAPEAAHGPPVVMMISLAIAAFGIILAWLIYKKKAIADDYFPRAFPAVYKLFYNKWYFDELYDATVIKGTLKLAAGLRWFDNTIIDGAVNGSAWLTVVVSKFKGYFDLRFVDGAVNGVADIVKWGGKHARRLQTGLVQNYMLFISVGLAVLVVVMILDL